MSIVSSVYVVGQAQADGRSYVQKTDTQVRNAFGLNVAQWTTLKTKMQMLVDHYEAVQVAQGE